MKYLANRDFNSLISKKSYKKGDVLTENIKQLEDWERNGMAVKESKAATNRKTKELKTTTKTK